jgi:hypothetical protein
MTMKGFKKSEKVLLISNLESYPLGSYGSVYKVKRKSDGRMLVWKELDYRKLNEKER